VHTDLSLLAVDLKRHVTDIHERSYEGSGWDRARKEEAFRVGFTLATPVALRALDAINQELLDGSGTAAARPPHSDGRGGLVAWWQLTWPILESTHDRTTGEVLPPVRVAVAFPTGLGHPHMALLRPEPVDEPRGVIPEVGPDVVWAWPFQVTSPADAEHLEAIICVLALGELHERTARSALGPFEILPAFERPTSWGHSPVRPDQGEAGSR
jgi:hypothetical protein